MKISIRHRRTYSLAVFCALTSVFLILYGCGGGGDGGGSAATAPGAPSSLVANAGDNQVTLSWSPVAGATSYNSYRGTSPGVMKTNGTKVSGVQSPNVISGLTNGTKYYFVVTAVNAVGESVESAEVSATPVAPTTFLQSDLTGTWDFLEFDTGLGSGWERAMVVFDASGNGRYVTNWLDDRGNTSPPVIASILTLDNTGVFSMKISGVDAGLHAHMSSDKKLIVGIMGNDNNASPGLMVFRKRTGVVYSGADLANTTFKYHTLKSGLDNIWEYGDGNVDAVGNVTVTSNFTPSGSNVVPPNTALYSVSPVGIVTNSSDPYWYGVLTDDKKVIYALDTSDPGYFSFGVIQITGQTYTQADYAGVGYFNTINSGGKTGPGWSYGSISLDSVGAGVYLTYQDATNGPIPAAFTRILSPTGAITSPTDPTYHGQMSYDKKSSVRTGTNASGKSQIAITIR